MSAQRPSPQERADFAAFARAALGVQKPPPKPAIQPVTAPKPPDPAASVFPSVKAKERKP